MSISISRITLFSFAEDLPKQTWKKQDLQMVEIDGEKKLGWAPVSRQPSLRGEEIEKCAYKLLQQALPNISGSYSDGLTVCLRNLCQLVKKTGKRPGGGSFGGLSDTALNALRETKEVILKTDLGSDLTAEIVYMSNFAVFETKEGKVIALRNRPLKGAPHTISLKTLSKEQGLQLAAFIETGYLPEAVQGDFQKSLELLTLFCEAVDASKCDLLGYSLCKRIRHSIRKSSPDELCQFLAWAEKYSLRDELSQCVEIVFATPQAQFSPGQKQKIASFLQHGFPNAAQPLLNYAEHQMLPSQQDAQSLQILLEMQKMATTYFSILVNTPHLKAIAQACNGKIKAFIDLQQGDVTSLLAYLDFFELDRHRFPSKEIPSAKGGMYEGDHVILALKNLLQVPHHCMTTEQQDKVKEYLSACQPEVDTLLFAYWKEGCFSLDPMDATEEIMQKVSTLLRCTSDYDLPRLAEKIEAALIEYPNESLSWFFFLAKSAIDKTEKQQQKENFKDLRQYLLSKWPKILKGETWDKKAESKLCWLIDTAYNDTEMICLFFQLGDEAHLKSVTEECFKKLPIHSFKQLPEETKKRAALVFLKTWLQDEQRKDFPSGISYSFDYNAKELIELIATHGKESQCLNFLQCWDHYGKATLTCKQLEMLVKSCEQLKILKLESMVLSEDTAVVLGSQAPRLRELTLKHVTMTDQGLISLSENPLTDLTLEGCEGISPQRMETIAPLFPHLIELDVLWTPLAGKAVPSLVKNCRSLKKLSFSDCGIQAEYCKSFIGSQLELSELEIHYDKQLDDSAIASISRGLKYLRSLSLKRCDQLSIQCVPDLALLSESLFEKLEIDLSLDDGSLLTLGRAFPRLKLFACKADKITNKGIESFAAHCHGLTHLSLGSSAQITDAGLKMMIGNHPHLEEISLCGCKAGLTDETLRLLADCPKLKAVDLSGTGENFTDAGLEALLKNKNIKLTLKGSNGFSFQMQRKVP